LYGFWLFMLVMDLLIPTMIYIGRRYQRKPPKEINSLSGYRTSMSMKNQDTWKFAHNYVGKIWFTSGIVVIIPTIFIFMYLFGKRADTIGYIGGAICFIEMIPMIGSILPTEKALHKTFDINGYRK